MINFSTTNNNNNNQHASKNVARRAFQKIKQYLFILKDCLLYLSLLYEKHSIMKKQRIIFEDSDDRTRRNSINYIKILINNGITGVINRKDKMTPVLVLYKAIT